MAELNPVLQYVRAARPLRPIYAVIPLTLSLIPVAALPFAPAGREFDASVACILFGTLFSPINLIISFLLARSYHGQPAPFAASVAAAAIAGVNTLLLLVTIGLIFFFGMPC